MTENPYQPERRPDGFEPVRPVRESRSSAVKKGILLAVLLLLLALIVWATYYFIQNRRLPIPTVTTGGATEEVAPPEYLYSIAGPPGENALTRPVGVTVTTDDRVYATDTEVGVVRVYNVEGRYQFTISDQLEAPAHLAVGPDGNIYVSDRRLRAIQVFTPEGEYLRSIAPTGEDAQTWSPLAMTFDKDGNVYATDVGQSNNHRVLAFTPEGVEIRRFGKTARVNQMSDAPAEFYFPNGIAFARDGRLFIGDSNNRRVQVFKADGTFDYFIRTAGIPRGITIDTDQRLYVVDALAHSIDVYSLEGERIVSFGGSGVGPGQFRYANDIALDGDGRIYVSDRENHQIQVWAWAEEEIVLPEPPKTAAGWAACLAPPLLLIPILFLLRRKRFVVTEDFVDEMVALGEVAQMDRRRYRWLAPETVWPAFQGRTEDGIDLGHLIQPEQHSDSDARALMDRYRIAYELAALLVMAKRAKRLCTEDREIADMAHRLDVRVFDASAWLEEFGRDSSKENKA